MTAVCVYPPYQPKKAVFELSPEVECVAFSREQAKRVMDDARAIATISPEYAKRLKIPKNNPIVSLTRGGHDGHNAVDLALAINADRRNEDFCVEIRQTCAGQTFAAKTFREMLMQGRLVFEESPLLMWCLKNAVEFENYYGDIRLSKKHKDDSQRIDPLAAVIDALSLALLRDEKTDLSKAAGDADYEM